MSARCSHRLMAVLVASTVLVGAALPSPATAAPAVLPDPGDAAVDWIEGELADDGGHLNITFDDGGGGTITVPDYGLTVDAILALAADGRGGTSPATTADQFIESNVASYISGTDFGFPDERYAGPIAKTLLMALIQGEDPSAFGGFDLEDELRDRLQTSGADAGRFSDFADPDNTFGGDFSNGFGQALAVMALARTSGGVPPSAIDFLLDQQCPDGGFRGNYSTPGGCTDDASATVDATGFALMALTAVASTCATRDAVTDAVASLMVGQNSAGAFGGESGSNANSTGVAAVALRSLGVALAADDAAAFISSLQLESGDDLGALSLNAAGETSAGDGIQILERDSFRRATTQGVLAFGLPSYAEIGASAVDPADFVPCDPGAVGGAFEPGGTITIFAEGFYPGEKVRATLHSTPVVLGTTTADEDGHVFMTVTLPDDLAPGRHEIHVVGLTSGHTVVLAAFASAEDPQSPQTPQTLPATGANGPLAGLGVALVGVGWGLVAIGRRRRARVEQVALG
jgi:hypothetical protein